jgi:streptogramin lyase/predicted Ser/Thr protein kinase
VSQLTAIRDGELIASYRVEDLVGRGGMGEVYRAWDTRLERNVALKILAPRYAEDDVFRERLLRESKLAASLDHANVVPVYDAGEVDGRFFLAMRFVAGTDLRALLRREGALPATRAVEIVSQVADALDAAHARGLVHRDVKPSNVLLDERGHCYLGDFGLTQSVASASPADGSLLGTLDYVAPEQIRGDPVAAPADIYSLGCLLYECLAGAVPFGRPSEVATIYAHLEDAAPSAREHTPQLPAAIDAVFARALAKDPASRPPTCAELVDDARVALGVHEPARSRRRWPLVAAASALLAVFAAAAALVVTAGSTSAARAPGELVRIDPASNEVVSRTPVQGHPGNLVVAGGDVWSTDFFEGVIWHLSPSTGALRRITSNGEPRDLASVGDFLYVAGDGEWLTGNVSRYDVSTGIRRDVVPVLACAIASGEGVVWTAGCPSVQRLNIDRRPLQKVAETFLPFATPLTSESARIQFRELAVGAGSLWVLGDALDRRLWRLDARTGRVLATVELGFAPRSVAVGGGAAWITDALGDEVQRIDLATNKPMRPVPVGRLPGGVAVFAGSVWVPNALDGTVSRIDAETGEIEATVDVGGFPREVAAGGGAVWVSEYED